MNRNIFRVILGLALLVIVGCERSSKSDKQHGNSNTDANSVDDTPILHENCTASNVEEYHNENAIIKIAKQQHGQDELWLKELSNYSQNGTEYYDDLILKAKDGVFSGEWTARKELFETDPSKITPEIHEKIANASRDMANDQKLFWANDRYDILRGYVKWCGEEAILELVKMVNDENRQLPPKVCSVLASTKDPRAAAAIVKRMRRERDAKLLELIKYLGPIAEDAILEGLPAEGSITEIELLRDSCGTEKSILVLKRVSDGLSRDALIDQQHRDMRRFITETIKKLTESPNAYKRTDTAVPHIGD